MSSSNLKVILKMDELPLNSKTASCKITLSTLQVHSFILLTLNCKCTYSCVITYLPKLLKEHISALDNFPLRQEEKHSMEGW